MRTDIPEAFVDLERPARYKAFFGGRGSAKSHSFAQELVTQAIEQPLKILCCREIQRSVKESVKSLLDKKIQETGASDLFRSLDTEIRGTNGSRFVFGGLRSNPDAIKSLEGLDRAWVEEANAVSRRSLDLLVPTVRKERSELWFSWNPDSELDPVDVMFRQRQAPPDSIVRQVSYADNPWFPAVLEKERLFDLETDPAKHEHVWLGGYRQAQEGAYYAVQLARAAEEGRLGRVPHNPAVPVMVAFDLGISVREPSMAAWFCQRVGQEIHLIDYLQDGGKGLEDYAREMRAKPYTYGTVWFPHDGRARELGTGKSRQEVMEGFGFDVEIAPMLSVEDGIEAVRRMLPRCWIDDDKCFNGLRALREYHERWDETRRVSMGPEHDWSSHPADALRYLAVSITEAPHLLKPEADEFPRRHGAAAGSWMM